MSRSRTMWWFALFAVLLPRLGGAQSGIAVNIVGDVFDSVSKARLSGAMVRIVRATDPSIGRSAVTDSLGGFRFDSVDGGVWLATFLHPILDSLRLEPGVSRLDLNAAGTVSLALRTPSARSIVMAACGPTSFDEGLLVGTVKHATDEIGAAAATVRATWQDWLIRGGRMAKESQLRRVSRPGFPDCARRRCANTWVSLDWHAGSAQWRDRAGPCS